MKSTGNTLYNEAFMKEIDSLGQISNNSSTQSTISNNDNITEQAELSEIETGNKNTPDFDEMISFSHAYLNYRKAKCGKTREALHESTYKLLTTNVFIYSGDIIDIKTMGEIKDSEAVKNIRKKINNYKGSDISTKMVFMENIPYYVQTIGFQETVESILPILVELPKEKDILTERFFSDYSSFIDEIVKFGDKGYFILKEQMIKLIKEILSKTKNANILKSVSKGLIYMTKFIKEDDIGDCIIAIVIELCQANEDEKRKEAAINLFGSLSTLVNNELIQSYAISQINLFIYDNSFNVRREIAKQFLKICGIIPKDRFEYKMLQVYKQLATDENLLVKKDAIYILPKLIHLYNDDNISKELVPIYYDFINDEKGLIKNSAVEIFGELISLIKQEGTETLTKLLNFYVKTIMELKKIKKENREIMKKCAYNFPAVLQFFGEKEWQKLKPCFAKMTKEKDEKIKMPLVSAMGEIAKILGTTITENDLLDYIDDIYQNNNS